MKPELEFTINTVDEIPALAEKIIDFAGNAKIILFNAPMGAGKTTLIKAMCEKLGSIDNFSSPTYSIINEYKYPGGKIYHVDLYRVKDAGELLDLGIEEYLDSGNYCFFEWPDLVEELIEGNYVKIEMSVKENIRYLRATSF